MLQMLSYMQNLAQEPDLFLPMVVEDFRLTVVDEEHVIARHEARDNALVLIAVTANDRIVGMWDCMGSTRPALQHALEFGMSVAREYRGQGMGAALLSAGLAWAWQSPAVHRVELEGLRRKSPRGSPLRKVWVRHRRTKTTRFLSARTLP